jgi:hypothetical protein
MAIVFNRLRVFTERYYRAGEITMLCVWLYMFYRDNPTTSAIYLHIAIPFLTWLSSICTNVFADLNDTINVEVFVLIFNYLKKEKKLKKYMFVKNIYYYIRLYLNYWNRISSIDITWVSYITNKSLTNTHMLRK